MYFNNLFVIWLNGLQTAKLFPMLVHIVPYWSMLVHGGLHWTFLVLVHTGPYWSILVHTGPHTDPYQSIMIYTGLYWSILVHTAPLWSIVVHSGPYWSILVHTGPYWSPWFFFRSAAGILSLKLRLYKRTGYCLKEASIKCWQCIVELLFCNHKNNGRELKNL